MLRNNTLYQLIRIHLLKNCIVLGLIIFNSGFLIGQDTVQIGLGQSSNFFFGPISIAPVDTFSRHSYIYSPDELLAKGILPGDTIVGIAWRKMSNGQIIANSGSAAVKIYSESSGTAFNNLSQNLSWQHLVQNATLVSDSNFNLSSNLGTIGWQYFEYDSIDLYNGGAIRISVEANFSTLSNPKINNSFSWLVDTTEFKTVQSNMNDSSALKLNRIRPTVKFLVKKRIRLNNQVQLETRFGRHCGGQDTVWVKVKNLGINTLNKIKLGYQLDNQVIQYFGFGNLNCLFAAETVLPIPNIFSFLGGSHNLKIWVDSANNIAYPPFLMDTLTSAIYPGLLGAYTLDQTMPKSATNFVSFSNFADSLNRVGVCGNVVLSVIPGSGPYMDQLLFKNIAGATDSTWVRIEGNGEQLRHHNVISSNSPYYYRQDAAITMLNSQNIVFDSLDVFFSDSIPNGWWSNFGAEHSSLCGIYGSPKNIEFLSCKLNAINSQQDLVIHFPRVPWLQEPSARNVNFIGNDVKGSLILTGIDSLVILNNLVKDFNLFGVDAGWCSNIRIIGNRLVGKPNVNIGYQVQVYTECLYVGNCSNFEIDGNSLVREYNSTGLGARLFRIDNCNGDSTNFNQVSNNSIVANAPNMNVNDPLYGLYLNNSSFVEILHNSILTVSGSGTSSNPFVRSYNSKHLNIQNNIFMRDSPHPISFISDSTDSKNYNNWFSTGSALPIANQGPNSVNFNPAFVSNTNLHLSPQSPMIGAGVYLPQVPVDIDGDLRSPNTPSIGADEPAICNLVASFQSTSTSCPNVANGVVSITVTSGVAPYTYQWSNGFSGTINSGLSNGQYVVTITDSLGCILIDSASVSVGTGALSINSVVVNETCQGDSNGSISTSVSGGSSPYNYLWSNGAVSPSVGSLDAGTYYVFVTDSAGCVGFDTIVISTDSLPQLLLSSQSATCFNSTDGTAMVNVIAPLGTFSYLWNDPLAQVTSSALNLVNGSYTVTVTSGAGCASVGQILVGVLGGSQSIDLGPDTTICNTTNVIIDAGIGFISYQWSNGDSTQTIAVDSSSSYSVIAIDSFGCAYMDTINIIASVCLNTKELTAFEGIKVYPVPVQDLLFIEGINGAEQDLEITSVNGKVVYRGQLRGRKEVATDQWASGVYILRVTDKNKLASNFVIIK